MLRTSLSTGIRSVISFALAVTLITAADLPADVVVMKNGNRFEGKVLQETPQKIVLKMRFGTMDFAREEIKEIIKKALPTIPRPKPKPEPTGKQSDRPKSPPARSQGKGNHLCQNNDVLDIKDAIAVRYKNYQLSVTFFAFKLSAEDMKELRLTRNPYEVVKSKPSPNRKKWAGSPYIRLDIEFADEKKGIVLSNIKEARMCVYDMVYKNLGQVFKDGEKGCTVSVKKLNLSMEGGEGTLDIAVDGAGMMEHHTSRRTLRYKYHWNMDMTCASIHHR